MHNGTPNPSPRRMFGAPLFMPALVLARTVRRAALIYTGAVSLSAEHVGAALARAQARGHELELALLAAMRRFEATALECDNCPKLRRRPAEAVPPPATREEQVMAALQRLGIPSRERVQALSTHLAAVEAEIDARLAHLPPSRVAVLPLAGYNTLTVSEIVERLDGLDIEQLNALRAYETSGGQRTSLLAELDRRIAEAALQA